MEHKIKHLEMIQAVINRFATNSFVIKGWCVTLVSALFALGSSSGNLRYLILAYFPALMFWMLDAYFLWQERLYRNLYDKVRLSNDSDIDFSMHIHSLLKSTPSWTKSAFSRTLTIFYGVILGAVLAAILII